MSESGKYRIDCTGRDRNAWRSGETIEDKGARIGVSWTVARDGSGVSIDVDCNVGVEMADMRSKVAGTMIVETGEEGKPHYTKYEFPFLFERNSQTEVIEYKNGEVFRNEQLEEEKRFDQKAFPGFLQYTIIVQRVEGGRILPERKVWDHLSPSCRHDKVVVLDDGTRFFVLSQFLAASSSFFDSLFKNTSLTEAEQVEVIIGGVSREAFHTMLKFIYPHAPGAKDMCSSNIVGELFALADRFDMPMVTQEAVEWTVANYWTKQYGRLEMMKWADQYGLLELQDNATKSLFPEENLHQRIHDNNDYIRSLPISTREKIYHCIYLQKQWEVERAARKKVDSDGVAGADLSLSRSTVSESNGN